jgi:hypothetical protein
MDHLIQVVGSKENNREEGNFYSPTEIFIKEIGNREKCMEKEFLSKPMDKENKVFGNMESFYKRISD